jgi:hypothetical protein
LNAAYLIQLVGSAAAVAVMVGVAAWGSRGRGSPPLDDRTARRWLADEFPGRRIDGLWVAADGLGAVAKSGDLALVLSRLGDGYVGRQIPWATAAEARFHSGRLAIPLADIAAPKAVLAFAAWPPQEPAA